VKHQKNLYSIEWAEEKLIGSGVRYEDIIKLPFYRSGTIYEAFLTNKSIDGTGIKSIIPVTSDYHTKRAYRV